MYTYICIYQFLWTASQEFYRVPSFAQYFKYSQILGTRPKFMSAHNFLIYFRETWDVYQIFTPKIQKFQN